jgi:hypothetical protein
VSENWFGILTILYDKSLKCKDDVGVEGINPSPSPSDALSPWKGARGKAQGEINLSIGFIVFAFPSPLPFPRGEG